MSDMIPPFDQFEAHSLFHHKRVSIQTDEGLYSNR